MDGVLVLDKPAGISSARAVSMVKRLLPRAAGRRPKIGHAGTLDPFATGVLLLLIGRATKSCEQLMDQPKTYETTIKLGATTETDDPESPEMIMQSPARSPGLREVTDAMKSFVGAIEQTPPKFSAIKIGGRRACDRVRDGQTVELKPRTVQVYSIDLLNFEYPSLQLKIDCGRGTYIRAIARDLGDVLGVGGYLTQLRRTRIGAFSIDDAISIDQLSPEKLISNLRAV
ncbi:MAG: tRNA pseudouridine(55) synthase TruB [Anaerolineae bacterium]|nr:tRNA pseudouridine(55) synthase TruB [Phycisphaerae bacterium]